MTAPKLKVIVDGVALPEEEARAFWTRFSEHMEKHQGDLAGFARGEGFASVRPVVGDEGPELAVSRSLPQKPYANAERKGSEPGSPIPQSRAPNASRNQRKRGRS